MKIITDRIDPASDAFKAAAAVVAVGVVATLVSSQLSKSSQKPKQEYLKPSTTLPVLGNLLDMAKQKERLYDWMQDVADEFDNQPWLLTIPGRSNTLVVSSPDYFEEVMKTKEDIFLRGPETLYIGYDMFGNGISTTDGDAWFYHRKTASNLFSMQMMRDVMQEIVREKLEVLVGGINGYIAKGKQVSYSREIGHFTMDVFTKIGFGIELRNLEIGFDDPHGSSKFNKAFNLALTSFGERIEAPMWVWELKKYFNIGSERVFKQNMDIINQLVFDVIEENMQMKQKGDENLSKRKDLVSLFVESKLSGSDVQLADDEVTIMRDMVFNFITAGKDTSAHAMCWFCVNMNRYPDVLRKIREEMKAKLPGLLTGEIQIPTVEQSNALVYLEAAIRESIRLYPSTGFITRIATEDTVLHDGTFVGKGTTVMVASWLNARNKKNWGDDAKEYRPERWIDPETGKLIVVSPFKFSSFGSGQHYCLGQKFALMEIKLAMATLWSKFDFKTVEKPEEITYEFSLTIPVKGPLNCVVTPLEAARAAAA